MSAPTGSLPTFRGNQNLNYQPGVITYFNTRYKVKITDENGQVTYLSNSAEDAQKLKRIMRILAQADYHTAKRDLKNTTISDSMVYVSGNKVKLPSEREVKIQRTFSKIFSNPQHVAAGPRVEFKLDDDEVSEKEEEPASVEPDDGKFQLIPNTKTKVRYPLDPSEADPTTLSNTEAFDFSTLNVRSDADVQAKLELLEETVRQYLLESIHAKAKSVTLPPIITHDEFPPQIVAAILQHGMNRINKATLGVARNNKETQLHIAILISPRELNKTKVPTNPTQNPQGAAKPQAAKKSKKAAASPQVLARQKILDAEIIFRQKGSAPTPAEYRVANGIYDLRDCKTKQDLDNREKELGANVFNELLNAIGDNKKVVVFPPLITPAISAELSKEQIQQSMRSFQQEVISKITNVIKDNPHKLAQIIFEA